MQDRYVPQHSRWEVSGGPTSSKGLERTPPAGGEAGREGLPGRVLDFVNLHKSRPAPKAAPKGPPGNPPKSFQHRPPNAFLIPPPTRW